MQPSRADESADMLRMKIGRDWCGTTVEKKLIPGAQKYETDELQSQEGNFFWQAGEERSGLKMKRKNVHPTQRRIWIGTG